MNKGILWERLRKVELLAQRFVIDLAEIRKELKDLKIESKEKDMKSLHST